MIRSLLLVLVLTSFVSGEGVGDSPEAQLAGPLTALLEKKVEALTEKIVEQSRLLDAMEQRIEERQAKRMEGVLENIREVGRNVAGVIQEVRADRVERVGLMNRLQTMYENAQEMWTEWKETVKSFTPFLWILEWFQSIIWAVVGVIVAFLVLLLLVVAIVLRMWLWVRNTVVPKDLRT
jgi:maltodextrin utilization protein YvdJ